jgi:hypothetical protein
MVATEYGAPAVNAVAGTLSTASRIDDERLSQAYDY